MKKFLLFAVFAALLASCAGEPAVPVLSHGRTEGTAETPAPYIITDHKNKAEGESIPEWVSRYYSGGAAEIEYMEAYRDDYVFIHRNEGSNFNALNQWIKGFDPDLDFPRMAAARIEARFASGVSFPDNTYGAFYETLIRAASDALWPGAVTESDFWIRRQFIPGEEENAASDEDTPEPEGWEFLILVSMEKNLFASRLDEIFEAVKPNPQLSNDEEAAVKRVRERFFEGF